MATETAVTEKQLSYIYDLLGPYRAAEGVDRLRDLSRAEASRLIDNLIAATATWPGKR